MIAINETGHMLAVYNVNLKTRGHIGVMRKVLAQAQGFSLNCRQVHMILGDGSDIVHLVFEAGEEVGREIITTSVLQGDFFVHVATWVARYQKRACAFELAYVRYYPMHNDELLQLAHRLHEAGVPLFVEMYTLEYQNELPEQTAQTDQYYFLQLAPLVTGFFTPSWAVPGARLQGKPLYKMGNGATWIAPQSPEQKPDIRQAFHLLGVGFLAHWHGYDRLFPLISEFATVYPNVDLHLFLVGEGPASAQLVKLAQEFGVADRVTFTGALDPLVLANRYAGVHVGIGTLGFHRIKITYAEVLKHREFMFYDLPFIYSVEDSFSHDQLAGTWRQSPDDSPIDLVAIYEQYMSHTQTKLSGGLIDYAKSHFTWQIQTQYIMNEIKQKLADDASEQLK